MVRSVSVYNNNLVPLVQASITTIDGVTLWTHTWALLTDVAYDDVRWVVDQPGGFIQLHADFGVDWYICGYQLSLP